jgi:hypothetical protein
VAVLLWEDRADTEVGTSQQAVLSDPLRLVKMVNFLQKFTVAILYDKVLEPKSEIRQSNVLLKSKQKVFNLFHEHTVFVF